MWLGFMIAFGVIFVLAMVVGMSIDMSTPATPEEGAVRKQFSLVAVVILCVSGVLGGVMFIASVGYQVGYQDRDRAAYHEQEDLKAEHRKEMQAEHDSCNAEEAKQAEELNKQWSEQLDYCRGLRGAGSVEQGQSSYSK